MKKILLAIIIGIFLISFVSAEYMPLFLKPINTTDNSLMPDTNFTYNFSFTMDIACTDVVYQKNSVNLTTGSDGIAFYNITIPDSLSNIPRFLCEARALRGDIPVLRKVHPMATQFFDSIYVQNINVSGNLTVIGNISTPSTGFFGRLGSLLNRISNLFVQNIDFSGYINGSGNINTTGNLNIWGNSSFNGTLMPMTSLTFDIGSGANRWRVGYFQNISSDYINNAYTITTGGITADAMNITYMNVTRIDVVTFNVTTINASYIYNPYFAGYMDLRGDPWYIGGTDLQIAENLIVDGNASADYFIGNVGNFTIAWINNINISTWALNVSKNYTKITYDTYDTRWMVGGVDGALNSSGWNRSGTYVFTHHPGDEVGIGTTSPNYLLDVRGTLSLNATTTALLRLDGTSYGQIFTPTILYTDASTQIFRSSAGSEYMRIDSSGNVGIGTTSPLSHLHQTGGAGEYIGDARFGGSTTQFGVEIKYNQSGATQGTIYASPGYSNAAILLKLGAGSDNPDQLVLKGDGNVGIGTTNPNSILTLDTSHASNLHLRFENTGVLKGLLGVSNAPSTFVITDVANDLVMRGETNILFGIGGTEEMRIDNTGNVGIGTNDPKLNLHIHDTDSDSYVQFTNTNTGTTISDGLRVGMASLTAYVNNNEAGELRLATNGSTAMMIDETGNVGIGDLSPTQKLTVDGNISFTDTSNLVTGNLNYYTIGSDFILQRAASSRLFKENIKDISIGDTNKLLQLNPKTYQRIDTKQFETGLIAEDVELINPDWVVYDYLDYNVSQEKIPFSVKYQDIAVATLGLVQEQQTQIDLMKQALCNLNQTQFCEQQGAYYCEDEDKYMDCSYGLGGTTRCYLNEEKTSWDSCASGWILVK